MRFFLAVFLTAAAAAQDADSLEKSARAAYAKGLYADARKSLEQAWDLMQDSAPADPKRYDILKLLSNVTAATADYAAAQKYVEMAVAWRETANGADDPKLAEEWIELSTLCDRQKNFSQALDLLQRSLKTHVRVNGPVSSQVADDFSRMALVYMDEKQPMQATPVLESAIDIREKVMGAEHPGILPELDRLGEIWILLREYEKAEATFRRALVIRERLLGPENSGLITTVEGLAYAQFGEKKYDDAEAGYKRLLALWLSSTGDPAHPMVALTLDKIAVFYRQTKRWDLGTENAERAIALRAIFLANGYAIEATAREGHDERKEAERYLKAAMGVLDESRPEHQKALATLQKALEELSVEPKIPTARVPDSSKKQ
jgi:tetratricopeptide (TPR) repeat protein